MTVLFHFNVSHRTGVTNKNAQSVEPGNISNQSPTIETERNKKSNETEMNDTNTPIEAGSFSEQYYKLTCMLKKFDEKHKLNALSLASFFPTILCVVMYFQAPYSTIMDYWLLNYSLGFITSYYTISGFCKPIKQKKIDV